MAAARKAKIRNIKIIIIIIIKTAAI